MANKIQIKRSTANGVVTGLANGELAYTSNGEVLFIGAPNGNGTSIAIGGLRNPGILTANQALVANATSGIDKVIVANLQPTYIYANGASGTAAQVLTSNSLGGVYWSTLAPSVAGTDTQVQFNDGGTLAGDSGFTFNKTTDTVSANTFLATSTVNAAVHSVGTSVVANSIGVFTTGTVNAAVLSVGTGFISNTTQVTLGTSIKLAANGALGTANQVLRSDGTGIAYWSTDDGDISAVTAGSGLTGGGTAGAVTLDIGQGNGISVSADAIAVLANAGLVANATGVHIVTSGDTTLIANATGLYVNDATLSIATSQLTGDVALGTQTSGNYVATITAGNGISGSATGESSTPTIAVVANNGIVSNSSGVFAKAANGISVDAAGINVVAGVGTYTNATGHGVLANNGIIANSTGTFVNGGSTLTVNATGVHVNTTLSLTDLTLTGNLTVSGTLTTLDTTNLTVKDSMIELANGNGSTDTLDIGIYGQYGSTGTKFTGLFRDATDGVYKLFTGLTAEPTTTVDTANLTYSTATLQAYLNSGGLVSNASAIQITANSSLAVSITANSLSLSTALGTTSGGTGLNTYTTGDLLYASGTNTLAKLAANTDGTVLQMNSSGVPVWNSLDGGTF